MGLDQYLYAGTDEEKNEIHYWRKHPNLHGLMCDIAIAKGLVKTPGEFNCVELPLEEVDLDLIEQKINSTDLPQTSGFFFGESFGGADERADDLKAIQKARDAIKDGLQVVYSSWW